MGIKGLAKLLSDEAPDSIREVPLSSLHGRKIAVDASMAIYQVRAHGSSSGSIDQESIFYLRSRGINEQQAKRMMIEGFLAEVINKVKNEDVRNIFYNKLNEINNT